MIGNDKSEIAAFTVSKGMIWLGDKNGLIHLVNAETLTPEQEQAELKTNNGYPVTSMASSLDGSIVAAGDSKGYITFFNAETRA